MTNFARNVAICASFLPKKSTIVECNNKTWARFLEFVHQCQNLEGDQAKIAKDCVHRDAAEFERHRLDANIVISNIASLETALHLR